MEPQEGELQQSPDTLPAEQPAASVAVTAPNGTEVIAPTPSFSWEASEYIFHEKPLVWYVGLWAVAAVLCGGLALMHQWVSIVVVVVMTLAVVVYSRKEPRTLSYALDGHGISIAGHLSSYHLFRSYSVHPELSWQEVDLEPARRFAPRLTILCEHDSFDQIEDILSQHLPRHDREPDWIEHFTRYIKF